MATLVATANQWQLRRFCDRSLDVQQIDVAVVGAGLAGAATAWGLSQRAGWHGPRPRVALLERETDLGTFASGRNAGILRSVVADPNWAAWCRQSMEVLRQSDLASLFAPVGCWLTSADEARLSALEQRAREQGVDVNKIGLQDVVTSWGIAPTQISALAAHALHIKTEGVIDPPRLLKAFVERAQAGATALHLSCGVTALRRETHAGVTGWRVTTTHGDWFARVVVNAAGSWCDDLVAASGLPAMGLVPMKRHIMRIATPSTAQPARSVWWHVDACEHYIRPLGNHEFIASTCDATPTHASDYAADAAMHASHRAHIDAWLPWLKGATITSMGCLRTFAPGPMTEEKAFIWELAPGYVAVCGLGGHGATVAALVGQKAAARVASLLA